MKKKFNTISFLILLTTCLIPLQVFASSSENTNFLHPLKVKRTGITNISKLPVQVDCAVEKVDKSVYSGEFLSIITKHSLETNEVFNSTIKIKNTGNTPWFSDKSGCQVSFTYLGTTHNQDRLSKFFGSGTLGEANWTSGNRIRMYTPRVDPGETAEFKFISKSPIAPGIYREYFAPVIEGVSWVKDKAEFNVDYTVGNPQYNPDDLKYAQYIESSVNLLDLNLKGEKKIVVDLSEQKMYLKIGDTNIKTFPVSTGSYKHPTPISTNKIISKQEVRVAASSPHYIMPKFMLFRKGGFGIHALPSLANDRGVFWREALNHIGSPRSHGCIRLLPKDADFVYEFGEIGTTVQVIR